MYKTLHKNTRRVYRPCTVHRNSDTIGCERTEPGSCSETMQEPKPVRGEQDFPLAMASWLVYLLTGWVGVWGRGWTYGLLKHGLVVGRPRHPKGWSWRALVPVSLNFSRLDSQSWTAVLQESAALSLSLLLLLLTPLHPPSVKPSQRWWSGGSEGPLALGPWLQLRNCLTPSSCPWSPSVVLIWGLLLRDYKCWSLHEDTLVVLGSSAYIMMFTVHQVTDALGICLKSKESESTERAQELRFWESTVVSDLPATAASYTDHCTDIDSHTHSYTHPRGLCVYGHTHLPG